MEEPEDLQWLSITDLLEEKLKLQIETIRLENARLKKKALQDFSGGPPFFPA